MRILAAVALLMLAASAGSAARPFRDGADLPEMVALRGGSFWMGSPDGEAGRSVNEGPRHRVTVRPFSIGRYDVTRGQYAAFVRATHRPVEGGCAWASGAGPKPDPAADWMHVDFAQEDSHPVICVTWADAQAYAAWLSQRTGHAYRLPSEAEWEYAARGGAETAFPWGDAPSHDRANYGAENCCSPLAEGRDRWTGTSPVGAFPANHLGLFDMSGNVLQWVQDCLHDYRDAPADGTAYERAGPLAESNVARDGMIGLDACRFRMLRGGDWGDPPRMIRAAYRNFAPPKGATIESYRSGGVGFRVARAID